MDEAARPTASAVFTLDEPVNNLYGAIIMKTKQTRFLALAAFLLAFTFAACDSDPSALVDEEATSAELTDLAARLSTDLNLSTQQAEAINSLVAVSGDERPEPGHLWTVAAELQKTLTDEQKATLFETVEQRTAEFAEGMRGRRFNRDGQGRRFNQDGQSRRFNRQGEKGLGFLNLTSEQQEQMKALREANREEMQALMEARQDGSLPQDDLREQAKALREAHQEEMQALLTDEQKATLEEKRGERKARSDERKEAFGERREEGLEARNEALGLTADQEAALAAMREEHQAERKALVEKIRAGNLDREAVKAEFEAAREANKAALAEILTPEQIEMAEIHDALVGGLALRRAGRRGPRGFGRAGN